MNPPRVVVFDAIETIFTLDPVRDRLERIGAPRAVLDVWFARLLRDAFALTAAGAYASFRDVAEGALRSTLAGHDIDGSAHVIERVFESFSDLPAHDDAKPAMESVAQSGASSYVLTNGTRATTTTLLERNDLARLVDGVVTVHDVGRWKPAPDPYRHVVSQAVAQPGDVALVAVHGWDILGARRAGLRTGWCARLEHHLSPVLGPADVEAASLDEVVTRLLHP